MATVSHLPHVLANVLVAQAARALTEEGERLPATGPELPRRHARGGREHRDLARHLPANADALVAAIDDTVRAARRGARGAARRATRRGRAWNEAARADRQRLLEADLAGGEVSELRVSVPNRPGVVAEVALALGRGGGQHRRHGALPAPDRSSGSIALWIAGEDRAAEAERADRRARLPVARA